jgi:hypothetical protein
MKRGGKDVEQKHQHRLERDVNGRGQTRKRKCDT